LKSITNGIFIAQFFNTGVLTTMVNANLEETIPPLGKLFNGPYPDYEPKWYVDTGATLISTLTLMIIIEICTEAGAAVTANIMQKLDQKGIVGDNPRYCTHTT